MTKFWGKLLGINFALGVTTGLTGWMQLLFVAGFYYNAKRVHGAIRSVGCACISPPRLQAHRALCHSGDTPTPTPTADYPPRASRFQGGQCWLQARTADPIATRAKVWAKWTGLGTIFAFPFAFAGIWLVLGIDGFRVVSMPALDATPNPLTKEVVQDAGAWLSNYRTYPWTIAFPALGFAGLGLALSGE